MATIRKRSTGVYEAQIRKHGYRSVTKTFRTKTDAQKWARYVEDQMDRSVFIDYSLAEKMTVKDVVSKYYVEVLPDKRSYRHEKSRVNQLVSWLGHITLARLSSVDLSHYRDQRLQQVGSQTVIHELGLLNRALKSATLDWGIMLPQGIPQVRKPKLSKGRNRRLTGDELERLLDKSPHVMRIIIQFAIETALRRGELAGLLRSDIDFKKKTIIVRDTKNGDDRYVPLSSKAIRLLKDLPVQLDGRVFGVPAYKISKLFLRARREADIQDLRYHDLRHEAVSRLFEKGLNHMEVSAISGHKTLQMLKRYTHLRAEDLAKKLG